MTAHGASADLLKGFLLKKVSMKMPSFPIRSWSASSKSSLATKSSSCTSKKKKCIYIPSTCFVLITSTCVASVDVILWWLEWSGVFVNNWRKRWSYRDSSSDQRDGSLCFAPLSFVIGGQSGGNAVRRRVGKSSSIFLVFKESCGGQKQMLTRWKPSVDSYYQQRLGKVITS